MAILDSGPGKETLWRPLSVDALKQQVAFKAALSMLADAGVTEPEYLPVAVWGVPAVACRFHSASDPSNFVDQLAENVVCDTGETLDALQKAGIANHNVVARPYFPPPIAYVDPRQATAPAATGPVNAGTSSSSMIYNPNLPAWQPVQPQAPQPQPQVAVAPRAPVVQQVAPLSQDDLINMLAKAWGISADALRSVLNMLKPPPPPPAVLPSVKVFDKNGAEIANGSTVTLEQVHGAKLVLSGNAGEIIAFQNWVDGGFMESNADQVVIMGGWKLGADGTLSAGIPFDGPSVIQKQATERRKFFSFPFGTANYHPLGELTLTLKFSDTLEYERSVAPLSWDPARFPYLVKFWTAAQLGISQDYHKAVSDALDHGAAIPPNPFLQFAPGSPQT